MMFLIYLQGGVRCGDQIGYTEIGHSDAEGTKVG
jgi:hypothetical protein